MIVVCRFDELSHSHPLIQIKSDPLSRRFRVFLVARLERFSKVHAAETGRHAYVMTTTDVRARLSSFGRLTDGRITSNGSIPITTPDEMLNTPSEIMSNVASD